MWREPDVGEVPERRLREWRFLSGDVKHGVDVWPLGENAAEVIFIDDSTAGGVDECGARHHGAEVFFLQHASCGFQQWGMAGDDVGAGKDFVQTDELQSEVAGIFLCGVRVVGDDFVSEVSHEGSDLFSDPAKGNESEGCAEVPRAVGIGVRFCCAVKPFVEKSVFSCQEDLADSEFNDSFGVGCGGGSDTHAALPHFWSGESAYGAGAVEDDFCVALLMAGVSPRGDVEGWLDNWNERTDALLERRGVDVIPLWLLQDKDCTPRGVWRF